MFNNLIESSSHVRELRRRGSFFLITTASYALFFVTVGIVSIHAYDARMKDQSLEIVTLLPPVVAAPQEPLGERRPDNSPANTRFRPFDERRVAMAPVDRVERPPDTVSSQPNPNLPVRDKVPTFFTRFDRNAQLDGLGGPGRSGGGGAGAHNNSNQIITEFDPPPAPVKSPTPKVLRKQVINSEAISLPKPIYPPLAIQTGTQGSVSVQVLIDEYGKVISAKTLSGHPLLSHEAVKAAYRARFSPTMLGDQPVKVSGVITYNFVLDR